MRCAVGHWRAFARYTSRTSFAARAGARAADDIRLGQSQPPEIAFGEGAGKNGLPRRRVPPPDHAGFIVHRGDDEPAVGEDEHPVGVVAM